MEDTGAAGSREMVIREQCGIREVVMKKSYQNSPGATEETIHS